jgi:hypothetical protein
MIKDSIEINKDGSTARMKNDEEAVQKVRSIVTNLNDPFTHQDVDTHVASGRHATLDMETDLASLGWTSRAETSSHFS